MRKAVIAVAPISMKLVTLAQRRQTVRRLIQAAAKCGARLVCFPEYVDIQRTHEAVKLPDRPHKRLAGRFPQGEFAEMVQVTAAENRIGVLYGQCAWIGRKLLNLTISVDARGKILGQYAKTHLAPDEGPEGEIHAGERIAPIPTVLGLAGVVTCYEVNFPEIARTQHARGARFLFVPTAGNSDAYFTMARARAAENMMPLAFSSYSFEGGAASDSCGASIIDSSGKVLEKTVHGTRILAAEINLDSPRGSPNWHGRGPIIDLRADVWKRRRTRLYGLGK
jgi:predicted amidohydrolase